MYVEEYRCRLCTSLRRSTAWRLWKLERHTEVHNCADHAIDGGRHSVVSDGLLCAVIGYGLVSPVISVGLHSSHERAVGN
jgi:hypothetical protein